MKRKNLLSVLFFIVSITGFLPMAAKAFDLKAHKATSGRTVQPEISTLNTLLSEVLQGEGLPYEIVLGRPEHCAILGKPDPCVYELQFKEFPNGVNESINGKTVRTWIEEGSQLEDSPPTRVIHHFHDPTRTWDQAGLRLPLLGQVGQSALFWAQDPAQSSSWQDARDSYYKALTGRTKAEREKAWAETFGTLGHLIHLVQDLASPAHTRNDPHLSLFGIGDLDGFHTWAEKEDSLAKISTMASTPFDPSILTLAINDPTLVPIARIMDTERYRETGLPEAGTNIGIAEYSNANFFSDDRMFGSYPFPNAGSVALGDPEPEPKTGELRRYFIKVRDGDTGYRLGVPSALFETLFGALTDIDIGLDDLVFQDYGNRLLPRAIGYSAGLIDYFFRGRMELQGPSGAVCNISCPKTQLSTSAIRNATPQEETGTGQMVAVFLTREGGEIIYRVSNSLTVTLTRDFQGLAFEFPERFPELVTDEDLEKWVCIFSGAVPCDAHFIYRGPLGNEADAIIVLRSPIDID